MPDIDPAGAARAAETGQVIAGIGSTADGPGDDQSTSDGDALDTANSVGATDTPALIGTEGPVDNNAALPIPQTSSQDPPASAADPSSSVSGPVSGSSNAASSLVSVDPTGTLTNVGQDDWIAVSLTANQAYEFTITGAAAEIAMASGDSRRAASLQRPAAAVTPARGGTLA